MQRNHQALVGSCRYAIICMVEKAAAPSKGKGIFSQSIMKSALKFCEYAEGQTQNAERYNPLAILAFSGIFAGFRKLKLLNGGRSALSFRRSAL